MRPAPLRSANRIDVLTPAEFEAIHGLLHRLEQRWTPPAPAADVWFAYDPLPLREFLPLLRQAMALTEGRRFLDLGCGIGRNLAVAHHLGFRVSGIDQHRPYLAAAAELLPEAVLTHGNILDLNEIDADIVYMYRPARAEDLQVRIEEHVQSLLTPGSVFLLPVRPQPVRVI